MKKPLLCIVYLLCTIVLIGKTNTEIRYIKDDLSPTVTKNSTDYSKGYSLISDVYKANSNSINYSLKKNNRFDLEYHGNSIKSKLFKPYIETITFASERIEALSSAGLNEVKCNNNATKYNSTDDYIEFYLNPSGSGLGSTYTVTVSSGTITPTSGTYGDPTHFRLQNGSSGGGNVTVTVHDVTTPAFTIAALITDLGSCSPCINNLTYLICPGESYTLTVPGSITSPQWYRNGVPIPGSVGNANSYIVTEAGNYTFTGTDTNGCQTEECCPVIINEGRCIFDLALYKKVAPGQDTILDPGSTVNFRITVVNQGNITADNIQITDYIPAELTLNDADWVQSGSKATLIMNAGVELPLGGLQHGQSASIDITMKLKTPLGSGLQIKNWAEISAATDSLNGARTDIDSNPDQTQTNDLFLVNNYIDGNGKLGSDEDDHDVAIVYTKAFDLALYKELSNGQSQQIAPGDDVNFTITVLNQGNIAADSIQVTDYIPVGMTKNDLDWSAVLGGKTTKMLSVANGLLPAGGLQPGSTVSVDITLKANTPLANNTKLTNWAEISATKDGQDNPVTDVDSNPDQNNTDTYLTDNEINGNGKGGGDEDDHDQAYVLVNPFDLALVKELANGQPSQIKPGDNVVFTVTVTNQGLIAADNIQLTDYIPAGMTLNDVNWTLSGSRATVMLNAGQELAVGGLQPGSSYSYNITLKANAPLAYNTKLVNWAEISATTDAQNNPVVDIDSSPDQNNTDKFLVDNDIDGDGKNGGDEDDHDKAEVEVLPFDLALYKRLSSGQAYMINPGEDVNYTITVVNQGLVPADNITLTDYIPAGMTKNDLDWTTSGSNATIVLNKGSELGSLGLLPGDSVKVDITLRANGTLANNTKLVNWTEISSVTDTAGNGVIDIDSSPDGIQSNDKYLVDNDINGDGKNGGDEDDHDQAEVVVKPYDLALVKKLATGQKENVQPGDNVNFTITVTNQGLITADSIRLVDYIPSELTLNDADWTINGTLATITLAAGQGLPVGGLTAGSSASVNITFTVNSPLPANTKITNWTEIYSSEDTHNNQVPDIDSDPDQNNTDTFLSDNEINGNGKNGGDEDDHDKAELYVNTFDLAMYKKLAPGQNHIVNPGENVNFRITVVNQGNIAADSIRVVDYIPSQMTLNDLDWTAAGLNATLLLNKGQELGAGGLLPGDSVYVEITLRVNNPQLPNTQIVNWSEIQSAKDQNGNPVVDIDSNPDNSNGDQYLVDNYIDGNGKNGGDEDDHDRADVITNVFDLALYKTLSPGQNGTIKPGENVNFRIYVVNQGGITANNINVIDYIPSDMTLNDGDWTAAGSNATIVLNSGQELPAGGLLPGGTASVDITLRAKSPLAANKTITNWSEISSARDNNNNVQTDIDSDPDASNNDNYLVDNSITGDGKNGGDEDDHDQAQVVTESFDLALYKTLAPGQSQSIKPGQEVNFKITIVNQGTIAADSIQVTDYIPAEMDLNDLDWSLSGTKATILLNAGSELPAAGLLPGDSINVIITLHAKSPLASNLTITNWSEISSFKDANGNSQVDLDSNPDQNNTDKFLVDNDINGNGKNGGDEDDQDKAYVVTESFDLALYKKLVPGQDQFIEPGDNVNYRIMVVNQGTIAADSIQITDYIPAEMDLNDLNWVLAGSKATLLINAGDELPLGGLLPGDSAFIDITLKAKSPLAHNLKITNWAEISSHRDSDGNPQVDNDSSPDQNNTDKFLADDYIDGNGKNGGDEDDHDKADVFTRTFDLALYKRLSPGQSLTVKPGQDVNFRITVVNQGSIAADNIQITDYIPSEMNLNDPEWTLSGQLATIMLNAGAELPAGGLLAGDSVVLDITLHAKSPLASNLTITNWAEISAFTDNQNNPQVDIDSNPDQNNTDKFLVDNDINGDGKNGGDEDDHDKAYVVTEAFDLALYKQLAPGQDQFIEPGDDVNYRITVVNQGTIAGDSIQVTDYIPSEMTLNDLNWSLTGSKATLLMNAGQELPFGGLQPGQTAYVEITLKAKSPLSPNLKITNWAEISSHRDSDGNPQVDLDSNPDQNNTDKFLVDDNIDGNGKSGGDEDDHDKADVYTQTFDLALYKRLSPGQSKTVKPAQDVNFRITVVNQGSIAADNIQVTDYIPSDMLLNDPEWTLSGQFATIMLNAGAELPAGGLLHGDSIVIDITLKTKSPLAPNLTITNWAEISAFTDNQGNPQVDIDSNPDQNNTDKFLVDNDINGDGKNGGDEDDHDKAIVVTETFDLAMYKKLAPGQGLYIEPGDNVNYRITVVNQGTIAADNIQLTDYIPSDMNLNDLEWISIPGKATITMNAGEELPVGGLLPGDSAYVDITLRAKAPLAANLKITNWAEISAHTDAQGNPQVDIDSNPDQSNTDKFLVDNEINGNGKNGGDEDDHDLADVYTKTFDLALYKKLAPGQNANVKPGENVTFRITVVNQGNINADFIGLIDYIPAEMTLADADWNPGPGNTATKYLNKNQELSSLGLQPGQTVSFDITLKVNSPLLSNSKITNWAEIREARDNEGNLQVDIDSDPDGLNNDTFVLDDEINGNGKNGGDEDDHDKAEVYTQTFDLALYKKLAPNQSYIVIPGENATFRITVVNQGTIAASNIQITDYIPSEMTLNDADWTLSGSKATLMLNIGQELPAGGLQPGDSIQVDITLKAKSPLAANLTIVNWSEISAFTDYLGNAQVDVDSDPDQNNTDKFLVDNDINGNGKNGGDEDDQDKAELYTTVFDLALNKKLAPGQSKYVEPGDQVTYSIQVINQGNIAADQIEVTDYLPSLMTLSDADWTSLPGSKAKLLLNAGAELPAGGLLPGAIAYVDITLKVNSPIPANTTITNWAEISAAKDANGNAQVDIDSSPDTNPDNDKYDINDYTDGNGKNGGDEDDHDPESVVVKPFDLALWKELAPGQPVSVEPGDLVNFRIYITNQGGIAAANIQLTDYVPAGMSFVAQAGWSLSGSKATTLLTNVLAPNTTTFVDIQLKVNNPLPANTALVNWAEISAATDDAGNPQQDIDSNPDQNNTDVYTSDNNVDGNGKAGQDEDDHDQATVVSKPFDLALIKELADGQTKIVKPGDNVEFTITVFNQGVIAADNIKITDYIPAGLTLNDPLWSLSGSQASRILNVGDELPAGGLLPGKTIKVNVIFKVAAPALANSKIINYAEISSATDDQGNNQDDVDSTPDNTNTDKVTQDNEISGNGKNGEDEDDHDLEEILVSPFDLALIKHLAPGQPYFVVPGANVKFRISIINQGTVNADNIEIVDYIPSGMSLADVNWTNLGNGKASTKLSVANTLLPLGGLIPGGIVTVDITLKAASPLPANTTLVNWSEIKSATDTKGNPTSDIDSSPDEDPDNDKYYNDDYIDGNGKNGGDEDDHDPAEVVVQPFDLALQKKLKSGQSDMVKPGDLVNFTINVVNQGAVKADNIRINDYIPAGLSLQDADWTLSGSTAKITLSVANGKLPAGGLQPGQLASVDITLIVNSPLPANTELRNLAEIASATDDKNNPQDDLDSTPDDNKDNDKYDTNDYLDGNGKKGGDEDDSDPEVLYVLPFDLALYKTLSPGQTALVQPGDVASFRIFVVNQGAVPAYNIEITDYLPSGMTLVDPSWTLNAGSKAKIILSSGNGLPFGGLQPGQTAFVDILVQIASPLPANSSLVNYAEISFAGDLSGNPLTDIDSQPDDVNNDLLILDNDLNGNGKKGGDEDDHDKEQLFIEPFDLALYKTLAPGQKANVAAGELVNFRITVVNQGTIIANNINIVDYIPDGMILADPNWSGLGNKATKILTKGAGLPLTGLKPTQSASVLITLKVASPLPADLNLQNWAEISDATDGAGNPQEDIDSSPDADVNNDVFLVDNDINGEGKNGGDEDDQDVAEVHVLPFDLALYKTLAPGQAPLVEAGDVVKFRITIINQGLVDADNIKITDYIPLGLSLADPSWTGVGAYAEKTLTKGNGLPFLGLKAGTFVTVDILLKINAPIPGDTEFLNTAEISSATDTKDNPQEDIDSTPDDNPDNDQYLDDNDVNGNGKFGEDEDDHDGAIIRSKQTFDLSLTKLAITPSPVSIGQKVTFEINLANQGKVDAQNVIINDHIPSGFIFNPADNPGWSGGFGATDVKYTVPNLDVAQVAKASIVLLVSNNAGKTTGDLTNIAEITSAQNDAGEYPKDEDSTPDNNPFNDDLIDRTDGFDHVAIDFEQGDEDDHDVASVTIGTFDLALTKLVEPGNYSIGSKVSFLINVANQGEVDAQNIMIVDYLPSGMSFDIADNPGWSLPVGNKTFYTMSSLNAEQASSISIKLTVNNGAGKVTGDLTNAAEIASAQNSQGEYPKDEDSTPDTENGDPLVDRTGDFDHIIIDDTADDEDDHDIAIVTIDEFDLALTKLVQSNTGNLTIGDKVTFIINVANQGTVNARNISISDYIPQGFNFLSGDNPGWNGGSFTTVANFTINALNAGEAISLPVVLQISNYANNTNLTNIAEITDAENESGGHPKDSDSSPDANPNNDDLIDRTDPNDHVNVDYEAGDEDDHDVASVTIGGFDLALTKLVQPGSYTKGSKVTFDINIANQGQIDATNIQVVDYVPSGLTFNDVDNPGWTAAFNNKTFFTIPYLGAGQATTIHVVMTINNSAGNKFGSLTNAAEIASAQNLQGEFPKDEDSTPDIENGDPLVDRTGDFDHIIIDDTADDEDDHDIAIVKIDEFDLALTKLVLGNASDWVIGSKVTFVINVANQGTANAKNIQVNDYIPQGLTFLPNDNPGWLFGNGPSIFSTTINTLNAGESVTIPIILQINSTANNSNLTNIAEITDAENEQGDHPKDSDSTPDTNPGNDQVIDRIGANDHVTIDNEPGDEDDHDVASVYLGNFDLALIKLIDDPKVYDVGDKVSYTIKVVNQGNINAGVVSIVDYIPSGLSFNAADNPGWSVPVNSMTTFVFGPLTIGNTNEIKMVLEVNSSAGLQSGNIINTAEISSATDDFGNPLLDEDSTPDNDPDNDAVIDRTGDFDHLIYDFEPGDEDDHDIAIIAIQSSLCVLSIDVVSLEAGCGLANGSLTAQANQGEAPFTYNWSNGLSGSQIFVGKGAYSLTVTDNKGCANIVNGIIVDENCTPNCDLQLYVDVNKVSCNGNDATANIFPLNGAGPYTFHWSNGAGGASATGLGIGKYSVTVTDALGCSKVISGIEVEDGCIPMCNIQLIANVSNESCKVGHDGSISLSISSGSSPYSIHWNNGSSMGILNNLSAGTYSVTVTDATGCTESLTTSIAKPGCQLDLALVKKLAAGQSSSVQTGDNVNFTLTVYNQGDVPVYNIGLTDYYPAGLQLSDPDWTVAGNKAVYNNTIPVLLPGQSVNVDILFVVTTSQTGQQVNKAEISSYDDDNNSLTPLGQYDIDSSPDANPDNDVFGGDDVTNNSNGDEDDEDIAEINIITTPVFDLAMYKKLAAGQSASVKTNDNVSFTLTVFNQGNVSAYNVELTDYIPAGLQLADANWNLSGSKAKLKTLIPVILPGGSASVNITCKVTATQAGNIVNVAEISKADDDNNPNTTPVLKDKDSNPDETPGNDVNGGDDIVDNTNGDEDDQDAEVITLGGCPTLLVGVPADKTIECNDPEVYLPATVTVSSCCTYQLSVKDVYVAGQCASSYVLHRTWTAADNCGVTTSKTQIITVKDIHAPVLTYINTQYPVVQNGDTLKLVCGNEPVFTSADFKAKDNCDPMPQVTVTKTFIVNQSCKKLVQYLVQAVDDCNNQASWVFFIELEDKSAPSIQNCPADLVLNCKDAIPTPANVTATDNCSSNPAIVYTETKLSGNCPQEYTLIRKWVATDPCGNASTCTQQIKVQDKSAPVINLAGVQNGGTTIIECNGNPIQYTAADFIVTDACDNNPVVSFNKSSLNGNCLTEGFTTKDVYTFTATDHCGNAATFVTTVIMKDTKAPVISNCPQDLTLDCGQNVPAQATVSATDNCDLNVAVSVTENTIQTSCPQAKTIIRTYIATDDCGNTASCVQKITITDKQAPTISGVPSNVTVECNAIPALPPGQVVKATDACDSSPSLSFNEVISTTKCPYTITRTWTAADACGNTSTKAQIITVTDNTSPVISGVPANVTIECTASPAAPSGVTATDACDPAPSLSMSEVTGTGKCPYTITRTWTSIDGCGNSATKIQVITIVDHTAPVISGVPANITVECSAIPAVPSGQTVKATDACDTDPSLSFSEVKGNGVCAYTITRTWTAQDDCGNISTKMQTISVVDHTAPVISGVPADLTVDLTSGGVIPAAPVVSAVDNCDKNVAIVYTVTTDTLNCVVTMIRKWTATDVCGNQSVKTQKLVLNISCGCIEPVASNVKVTDAGCGLNNGKVEIEMLNGNAGYDFSWLPNQGTANNAGNIKTNLPPGNYTVIVSYKNGQTCFKKLFVKVKELAENIIPEKELTIINPDCSKDVQVCLGFSMTNLSKFDIYDNGIKYNGQTKPCDVDTVRSYTYSTVPGLGNSGPYVLESWLINGVAKTGEFTNIKDLVNLMNVLDPQGNWLLNSSTLSITGGMKANTYGQLKVKQKNASGKATMDINTQQIPHGTSFNFASGQHKLVFVHKTLGCSDTVNIKVNCILASELNMDVQVGKTKKICIDNSQLPGTPVSMVNVCDNLSGEFSTLNMNSNSYCIDINGVEEGTEKACIIVCDNLGYCDTTYVNINVKTNSIQKPNANDDNITMAKGKSESIRVLGNDTFEADLPQVSIITNTDAGYAYVVNNQYINLDLNKDQCDAITLEYEICNKYGCDTATVYVNITCADLVFHNGISPNEDGSNDTFIIEGIEKYPDNKLTIYNRWGNEVLSKEGYQNDWKAEWENKILPDGTYFYIFTDGAGHKYSGYVQVQR